MKRVILSALFLVAVVTMNAQEEGKVRVGLDFGLAIPSGGVGFMFNAEPKYNLNDNMNVGIRFGVALLAKNVDTAENSGEVESLDIAANSSYLGTFDYYFPTGSSFTPFVGAGLGVFNIAAVSISDGDDEDDFDGTSSDAKFGGMLRGGFEVGKFRLALEYDLIPKTTLEDIEGNDIGDIKNGYLGITAGFFIGGGRW